jgi:hypothetical protein
VSGGCGCRCEQEGGEYEVFWRATQRCGRGRKEDGNKLLAELVQQEAPASPLAWLGEIEAYGCPGAEVDGAEAAVWDIDGATRVGRFGVHLSL